MKEPDRVPNSWRDGAVIAAMTLLAHFMALGRGFVWDDVRSIEYFRDEGGLWKLFVPDPFGFVRPGKTFVFSLFYWLFKETSWPYQVAALLVVAATGAAFFGLARCWLSRRTALLVAVMYVCHPFHLEASFWFSALNGTILTLLGILYCRLTLARNDSFTPGSLAAHSILYLAALMFKEEAVVLPVMAFLMLFSLRRKPSGKLLGAWVFQYMVSGVVVAYGRYMSALVGQQLEWLAHGAVMSATSPRNILSHFLYFFAPFWWSYNHVYDLRPLPFYSMAAVGYVALGLAVWWVARDWRLRDPARLGLLLAVVAMLPVANVLPMGNAWFAARYLCNAGIGLLIMLGAWLDQGGAFRGGKARTAVPVLICWIAIAVVVSNIFHLSWRNTEAFLLRGLAENRTAMFLSDLARLRLQQQKPEEALALADEAVERDPKRMMGHKIRGIALYRLGRREEALAAWKFVEEHEPLNVDNVIQIAFYYDNKFEETHDPADWAQAERYYRSAMGGANNNSAVACNNLGLMLMNAGKYDEAVAVWREGARRFPHAPGLAENLRRAAKDPRANATSKPLGKPND